MSCCPHLRTPSPRSSTHPGTPAHTLCISGGTLKKRTALSLNLPPVCRAQVEFEATPAIYRGDNAISLLQIRLAEACSAVLLMLSVYAWRAHMLCRVAADGLRARAHR